MDLNNFKTSHLVIFLLLGLIVLTIFVPPISCQHRRQRGRGHHHGRSRDNENSERHYKRAVDRYICEETEEDIQRLKSRIAQCKCPSTYAPVCGSDGQTYHNRCFIHCAAQEKYQRFHRGKQLTIAKMAEC